MWTLGTKPENVQRDACFNNCSTIPRVYSGTAMDVCVVFAPNGGQGSAILFYDLLLSFPLDTIVLPYTIYGQLTEGNLAEPEQCQDNEIISNKRINSNSL
jgi:uncharacterized protein YceK